MSVLLRRPRVTASGVVHRDEDGVNLVHDVEKLLATREVVRAEGVENEAAQFADGIGEASKVRRGPDAKLVGGRHRAALDEGEGYGGLGVLLQGVFDVAAVVHAGLLVAECDGLARKLRHRVEEVLCLVELAAVGGADGVRRVADDLPRKAKSLLAVGVGGRELLRGGVRYCV